MADKIQKVVQKVGAKAQKTNGVEIEDTKDEDLYIAEMKQNIINNQDKIKLNFIKISHLQVLDDAIRNDEELDDEKREELLEELEEQATSLSFAIASSVFEHIKYKYKDNQKTCIEGCAFAGYVSSHNLTIHNDIDAQQADFTLQLEIDTATVELGYRYFNEDDGHKEWLEWNGIDIKLQ